ncbi:hypothetical protein BGX29_006331 [Mortierella sp. GBA35]|nr:hypothetical protein BGX29_006331 [Mortierella sp. GBA35]
MDLGAGFDAAAHDYDGLLREPASVENMTNGGPGTSPPTMADPPRGPTFIGSSGVSEVKLKRFLEHNQRLREHLEMPRIPVSEASNSLIHFVTTTRDALLPSLWGTTGADPFAKQSTGCCTIS